MICPQCGRKSLFDWQRCPKCGADPWAKPGDVIAASAAGDAAAGSSPSALRRIGRYYTSRPVVARILLVCGSFYAAYVSVLSAWVAITELLRGEFAQLPLAWISNLVLAATPGLYLIAAGEALALLARIAESQRELPPRA